MLRLYFPQELDALLERNGFLVLHKFGSFEEERFESRSRHQIVVARVAGGS
ncbi:MAG: hypothetical protein HY901_13970 [Deltaproteobacteria bacterium]|nr:hypothetical protein [Deltaproteobacteria bacterium]